MADLKDMQRYAASACVILGTAPYVVCLGHLCMAGHMQHPPYPAWGFANDAVWILCFAVAGVLAILSNLRYRYFLGVAMPILIFSRLCLGDLGTLIEIPLTPGVFAIAIVGFFRKAKDLSDLSVVERRQRRWARFRRWVIGIAVVVGVLATVGAMAYGAWRIQRRIKQMLVPVVKIGESEMPYSRLFKFQEGDARRFSLPNGKEVAVWCETPRFPGGPGESASGLAMHWGERPFERLEIVWTPMAEGGRVATGWKSYIRQGVVSQMGPPILLTEHVLYVDRWTISLTKDLTARHGLPIKVAVRMASEAEQVPDDRKWGYYVGKLKDGDAVERVGAMEQLWKMVYLGDMYAGSNSEFQEHLAPLVDDADPCVARAAAEHLEWARQRKSR